MEMEGKRSQQIAGVEYRDWESLNPTILALIFVKIVPDEERVRSVSLVCRGWMEAMAEPDCWTEINVEQWCHLRWRRENNGISSPNTIDYVVRKLVRRSKFTFTKLIAYRLGNAGFSYVANCARVLTVLHIRVSEITDQIVEKHAESLANLKELDISCCWNITSRGLEAFGRHCKLLTHLKRNWPPWEPFHGIKTNDQEALSIAQTMLRLHHLELEFCTMSDLGLDAILTSCNDLSYLDIHGCENLMLEGNLERRCKQLLKFKGVDDGGDTETSSEESRDNDVDDGSSSPDSS